MSSKLNTTIDTLSTSVETDGHHGPRDGEHPSSIDCSDLDETTNKCHTKRNVEISLTINGGVRKFVASKDSFIHLSEPNSQGNVTTRFAFDSVRLSKDDPSSEGNLSTCDIIFLLREALNQVKAMAVEEENNSGSSFRMAQNRKTMYSSKTSAFSTTLESTREDSCEDESLAGEEQDHNHRAERRQKRTPYLKVYARKFLGSNANLLPQPLFSWKETAWTFSGVLITVLVLFAFNYLIVSTLGRDHAIIMGPFGALLTLQYGVTSAPLGQPRNIIYGQTVALMIAFGVGSLSFFPVFVRQSLATALVIATMVKFAITHPPAGAVAIIVSDGRTSLGAIYTTLIANVIAIVCATFINNLCEERQYPMKWDLVGCFRSTLAQIRRWCAKHVTKTSNAGQGVRRAHAGNPNKPEDDEMVFWEPSSGEEYQVPELSTKNGSAREERIIRMPDPTVVLKANHQSFRRYSFSVMQWKKYDMSADLWKDVDLEANDEIFHG